MMNRTKWMGLAAAALAAPLALMVVAPVGTAQAAPGGTSNISVAAPAPRGSTNVTFSFFRQTTVQRYLVTCSDATRLDVEVADLGLAGDFWGVTVKSWDVRPNTAECSNAGGVGFYGGLARVFTYNTAGAAFGLSAMIEVRYRSGINNFGAAGDLRITTNNTCTATITDLGQIDEI